MLRAYRTQVSPQVSLHFALILGRPHLPLLDLRVHERSLMELVHATTLTPGANGGYDGRGGGDGGAGGDAGGGGGGDGVGLFGGLPGGTGGDVGDGMAGGSGGAAGGGRPFWQTTKSDEGQ